MNEQYVYGEEQIYPQLDKDLKFRLHKIKETEDFLIAEINDTNEMKKMSKTLN